MTQHGDMKHRLAVAAPVDEGVFQVKAGSRAKCFHSSACRSPYNAMPFKSNEEKRTFFAIADNPCARVSCSYTFVLILRATFEPKCIIHMHGVLLCYSNACITSYGRRDTTMVTHRRSYPSYCNKTVLSTLSLVLCMRPLDTNLHGHT